MVCLSAIFLFVQNSAFLSYRLLKEKALHAMVQDNALVNFDECSDGEYCTVPMEDRRCPKVLGVTEEWESQCAKCNVDPSKEPNNLDCKTCALDTTVRLPMCTSCEDGWISLIWFQHPRDSTRRWQCVPREFQPNEVPALCSKDPHKMQIQHKRQAWWGFQDGNGNFQPKLVHLSVLENLRNKRSRGDPDHVFIKMRVFRKVKHLKNWKRAAELEYVFQLRKADSWVRHAQFLKNNQKLLPADDQNMVWYLDDVYETEKKQFDVQVVFVKNVRNDKGQVLKKKVWKKVPKMRFTELTMQALGLCFDFWLKGRLPRHDLFSRSAASIWYRVSQFFDHKDFQTRQPELRADTQTHIGPNRCPAGEYCTYGPHNAACTPPGRCLPCNQDDDGRENGLLCSVCSLSTRAGVRSSVPSCQVDGESTCNVMQTPKVLVDDTEVRRRWYCRPAAYTPGEMPMLCKAAEQKGLYVASPGELWSVQRKGSSTRGKRVRFLPIASRKASDEPEDSRTRVIDAYILFFPGTESLRDETVAFLAGSSIIAEQMLQIQFKSTDNLLYVPGTDDFDDEHALFKYHGKKKVFGELLHTLSFNQRVTDFNTGEPVVGGDEDEEENMVFFLSEGALLALTACFDSFINDRPPNPLLGLRETLALNFAKASSASIARSLRPSIRL